MLGSERLTGALLDRLTHHVHILEMNVESYRLKQSKHTNTNAADSRLRPSPQTPSLPTLLVDSTPARWSGRIGSLDEATRS